MRGLVDRVTMPRSSIVYTALAIAVVAMIPPVILAGMTAVLWLVDALAALPRL